MVFPGFMNEKVKGLLELLRRGVTQYQTNTA